MGFESKVNIGGTCPLIANDTSVWQYPRPQYSHAVLELMHANLCPDHFGRAIWLHDQSFYHGKPSGTLCDNDAALAHIAGFKGVSIWLRHKLKIMRVGWIMRSDGLWQSELLADGILNLSAKSKTGHDNRSGRTKRPSPAFVSPQESIAAADSEDVPF